MKLDVVIAIKNQSEKLLKNLKALGVPYFDSLGIDYDFIIVCNASTEQEQKILWDGAKELPPQVHLLPHTPIPGKGHGVQLGIEAATGDYVLFMDADFATDLKTFEAILPEIDRYDAFIASRHSKGSVIENPQSAIRRFISWGSRRVIHAMFHFHGIHDTQCGYKLFRTDVAKKMVEKQTIAGFAFDVEYLYFLKLNGYSVKEIPTHWTDDPASSLGHPLRTSWRFFQDLCRIHHQKKHYRLSKEERAALPSRLEEREKTC